MLTLQLDAEASALLEPVQDVLKKATRLLPGGAPVAVRVGSLGRPYLVGTSHTPEVVLDRSLLGPELHVPWEPCTELPPLDRWRRALACVLEGCALVELARRSEAIPDLDDWRWVGAAIYAADMVAPDVHLALPDLAVALSSGDLGAHPRAGVVAYLAWRQAGVDPITQAQYLIEGGVVSGQEWLKLGGWVFDTRGPMSRLPQPVTPVAPVDIPATLPPWSWRMLRVPAHRRGGFVEVDGPGAVHSPWAPAAEPLRTLAGSPEGSSRLTPSPGGPVGAWEVASAEAFGQIVGARGIRFDVRSDGRLELTLADAFVGPLAAVAMADELGTSGVTEGSWAVAGPHRLAFAGLERALLTMHGRRQGFALPSGGFGLEPWLKALCEEPWAWKAQGDRLVLRGTMRGGAVEVRLRAA